MDRRVRADAMWLAEQWSVVCSTDNSISYPTEIRRAFNDLQSTPPAPELTIETPSRLTAGIEVVAPIAKKVNKLVAMAERGPSWSPT